MLHIFILELLNVDNSCSKWISVCYNKNWGTNEYFSININIIFPTGVVIKFKWWPYRKNCVEHAKQYYSIPTKAILHHDISIRSTGVYSGNWLTKKKLCKTGQYNIITWLAKGNIYIYRKTNTCYKFVDELVLV